MALGVSPAKFEFVLPKNQTETRQIFIQNLDNSAGKFKIEPANFKKFIEISNSETIILAQEIKPVEITINGKKSFQTELLITQTEPYEANLKVMAGIKIPVLVEVKDTANNSSLPLAFFLALLTVAIFYVLNKSGSQQTAKT